MRVDRRKGLERDRLPGREACSYFFQTLLGEGGLYERKDAPFLQTDAGLETLPHLVVVSSEGRGRGSRLARLPDEVTLRDAVEAVEGPFEITRCIMQQRPYGEGRRCALHEAWTEGQNSILERLGTRTLADFSYHAPPFDRLVPRPNFPNP